MRTVAIEAQFVGNGIIKRHALLIYTNSSDLPISIGECTGVVVHVVDASRGTA